MTEIKEAIAKLNPREYCELMAELHPWPDDEWDLEMKADSAASRLDFVRRNVEQAKAEDSADVAWLKKAKGRPISFRPLESYLKK